MASNVYQDNIENNEITLFENLERVSQLENQVDALSQENRELFVLLQNERRKSKLLQRELDRGNPEENAYEKGMSEDLVTAEDSQTSGVFLQNVILMLKEKLESKESECEDLEDKLSVMNQELGSQGEELARATLEFEHQLKHAHELLAQERDLNSFLSEESDQTVRELQSKIQEKDYINTELKVIQDETSERMQTIEEECRFYQKKLHDTETLLSSKADEQEQLKRETDSVSCQVSVSELHALAKCEHESNEREIFCELFTALWAKDDIEINELRNANRHKMSIFKLIRNGFKKLKEMA